MDDLHYLRCAIPDFAGYEDETTRRLSDEQVRAVAGSALAQLGSPHADFFKDGLQEQYQGLLLKCGFANQAAFKHIQHAQLSNEQIQALEAADARLTRLLETAEQTAASNLQAYLDSVQAALKARDDAMMGVGMPA